MATFVCVHGAFQGGWVFSRLARALRARGHEVYAPTLSGCGYLDHDRERPVGLGTFCSDLTQFFELEDLTGVVLVGHSYSGLVCLGSLPALASRLAGCVFVETIMPDPGHSFADLGGEPFRAMLRSRVRDGGLVEPWPAAMFGLAGSPLADWFMARVAPFPLAAFTDALPDAPAELPSRRHYVRCTENPNPMLAAMAKKAESHGFAMHAIASGHCPQMTATEPLAALLAEIATSERMGA